MGRAPRADLIVDAPLVSRIHCRFLVSDDGELVVEDLGSTNGTFVNGEKAGKRALAEGDTVAVGRVRFAVAKGG